MATQDRRLQLNMWRAGAQLAQKRALEQAYEQQNAQLLAQLPQIQRTYDAQRQQAYQGMQFAQRAQREALAAQGLTQAGAGRVPTSGYAQVQDARRGAALQGALLQSMLAQQEEMGEVERQRQQALYERDTGIQQSDAQIQKQYLDALAELEQFEMQQRWNQEQLALSQQQFAQQLAQQQAQYAQSQQAQRVENAWRTVQALGYVPNATIAQLIGVPVGTRLMA